MVELEEVSSDMASLIVEGVSFAIRHDSSSARSFRLCEGEVYKYKIDLRPQPLTQISVRDIVDLPLIDVSSSWYSSAASLDLIASPRRAQGGRAPPMVSTRPNYDLYTIFLEALPQITTQAQSRVQGMWSSGMIPL